MTIPDLSLDQAWDMLAKNPRAILIDVRTTAEWQFVGVPSLGDLNHEIRFVEWTTYPTGAPNTEFLSQATEGLESDQPIVLLCRSGARSRSAGELLQSAGYSAFNIAPGFEGDLDGHGHRHGGWKQQFPWSQS